MMSDDLGRQLLAVDPPLEVQFDAMSRVTGFTPRPLYDADAPFTPDPQPVGHYLELTPDGLAGGAGC